MSRTIAVLVLLLHLCPASLRAAGFAHDEALVVLAPNQALAESVLEKAQSLRKSIAIKWLGQELPAGQGQSAIHVKITDEQDAGLTWPARDSNRKYHKMFIRTSKEQLDSVLAHEMTHLVFATAFAEPLPTWADEGAASLEDGAERTRMRQSVIESLAARGDWPSPAALFGGSTFGSRDAQSYALAASLTEYLVGRKDRATFLRFSREGAQTGWEAALQKHYQIDSFDALRRHWSAWAARSKLLTASDSRPRSHTAR